MARAAKIPPSLEAEVYRRAKVQGQTYQQVADWLLREHQIQCSDVAVLRCCQRQEARPPQPGRQEQPPEEVPLDAPLPPPTEVETLRHLRREVFDEVKAAKEGRGAEEWDWKRYHSALRLALQGDAALIRRTEFDERPLPAPTAGGGQSGDGATGEMTQEERDRMVQEAVN